MTDNKFQIVTKDNQVKNCEIICTITNKKTNSAYLVYKIDDEILAGKYFFDNENNLKLENVTSSELDYINKKLNEKIEVAFKGE